MLALHALVFRLLYLVQYSFFLFSFFLILYIHAMFMFVYEYVSIACDSSSGDDIFQLKILFILENENIMKSKTELWQKHV